MKKIDPQPGLNVGEHLPLTVGTPLNIGIKGIDCRLESTVIGISPDKYLIIELPTNPSFFIFKGRLSEGTFLIVRYLYQGKIIGFTSEILTTIPYPEDLVFLKYPTATERFNLRTAIRVPCTLAASLLKCNNDQIKGALLDVSDSGCRFFIKESDDENTIFFMNKDNKEVEVILQMPGREGHLILLGNVRRIEKDKRDLNIGIEFEKKDKETSTLIDYLLGTLSL